MTRLWFVGIETTNLTEKIFDNRLKAKLAGSSHPVASDRQGRIFDRQIMSSVTGKRCHG
jgi:hypothetical protein